MRFSGVVHFSFPFLVHFCSPGDTPAGQRYCQTGDQFGKDYFYKWWKKACTNLGIDGVDLYGGTRHSTATASPISLRA